MEMNKTGRRRSLWRGIKNRIICHVGDYSTFWGFCQGRLKLAGRSEMRLQKARNAKESLWRFGRILKVRSAKIFSDDLRKLTIHEKDYVI